MRFAPDLPDHKIPNFLRILLEIPTPALWDHRAKDFEQQIRANPLIESYIDAHYSIERTMERVRNHKKKTGRLPDATKLDTPNAVRRLYNFAAMIAQVYSNLSAAGKNVLKGRIRGALRDDIGLAPLVSELEIAIHVMRKGFDVEFHDLEHGGGYDFFAKRDDIELEIECKAVSGDLGRKIHLRRQYQLGGLVYPVMKEVLSDGGGRLAIATLPDRLHGDQAQMQEIASSISRVLKTGNQIADPAPCSVAFKEFDIAASPFSRAVPEDNLQDDVVDFCQSAFGYELHHLMMIFRPGQGAVIVAVQSARKDDVLRSLYRQTKEASRQLSGDRPGVICVNLMDVTADQLHEIADVPRQTGKITGLDVITAKLFKSPARVHVHTIAYTVPGQFVRRRFRSGNRMITDIGEVGPSYFFTSKKHPLANDPRLRIFSSDT